MFVFYIYDDDMHLQLKGIFYILWTCSWYFIIIFYTLDRYDSKGVEKLQEIYNSRNGHQSMHSMTARLSCNKTALKHCTSTEQRWDRNWSR